MAQTECLYCYRGYDDDGRICMVCRGSGKMLVFLPEVEIVSHEEKIEKEISKLT